MLNENLSKEIAAIVKFHRKKSGLNRVELARLAEVGKTVIFDIEHTNQGVRLNTLCKVLNVLNIKIGLISPLMSEYYKAEKDA